MIDKRRFRPFRVTHGIKRALRREDEDICDWCGAIIYAKTTAYVEKHSGWHLCSLECCESTEQTYPDISQDESLDERRFD